MVWCGLRTPSLRLTAVSHSHPVNKHSQPSLNRNSFVAEVLGNQPSNTTLQAPDLRRSRRLAGLPPLPLAVEMSHGEDENRIPAAAGLAPVPAAPLVPASGAPGPWLRQDMIVPRTFGGKSGEDVDDWLTHYKRVSKYYQWDAATQLSNVVFFLTDTALVWYENHEDALTSWDRFVSEIRECFGDSIAKRKQAEQTLLQRAQIPGETCTTYIEAILKLCKIVNPSMPEEDKVGHLLKGIAEDVYQFLIGKESLGTVTDVIRHCRTFETLKMRRITPKFGRLPNVTTVASVDEHTPFDLASTIREIVREELTRHARLTPHEATPVLHPSHHHVSIAAAGVDDYNYRSGSPLRPQRNNYPVPSYEHRFSYPRQPANTYQDPNEDTFVPPPRQRNGNAFQEHNVYRQSPVCYRCGVAGHIARFCRRQREPTSRYDSPSAFPPAATGHNSGHRPAYFRSTSRRQNHRSSSPASDRSLTPPSGRMHRSPSPGRRLSSPPPPGN